MLIINECDVINGRLIIEATVDSLSFFRDVRIGSLIVDTDETFAGDMPSSKPVFVKEFPDFGDLAAQWRVSPDGSGEDTIDTTMQGPMDKTRHPYGGPLRHIRVALTAREMGLRRLDKNMFIVHVGAAGFPLASTPCGMDRAFTTAVAYDKRPIYTRLMAGVREIGRCDTPRAFIDAFLRHEAVETAIRTGNIAEAIAAWKELLRGVEARPITDCGCHGTG